MLAQAAEIYASMAEYGDVEKGLPIKQYFADGLYARQMSIPAGGMVLGRIHKYSHIAVFTYGTGMVACEEEKFTFSAPLTLVCKPGTQRVIYAATDTILTTFHATKERSDDVDAMSDYMTVKTPQEFAAFLEQEKLKAIGG
jgi:hypothetical protein